MFKASMVKSCIVKALKKEYPDVKVYKERQEQNMADPCFFVRILDTDQSIKTLAITQRELLVNVRYISSEKLEVMDEVANTLFAILPVLSDENIKLRAKSIKGNVQDGVLQMFIEYGVSLIRPMEGTKMASVESKEGVKQ